jgi:hypothetical protein
VNAWQTLAAVLGGGGVAGLLGSLLTGLLNRPKVRAEAVSLLTDAALKQVNELQERTAEAEQAATAARREAAEASRQMRALTVEVDAAVATLRNWRAAVLSPAATLDGLRAMVAADMGHNGRLVE